MDPLTHVLAGVVAGGLFEAGVIGQITAVAAAIAPDAEFVTRKIPRTAFLDYHHGLVHTVPGALAAAVLVSLAMAALTGRAWPSLLPVAIAGVVSHLGLDLLMHNNGIALFAPFSRRRFSFPLVLGLNPETASPDCRDGAYSTCLVCQANGMRHNPFFWVLLVAAVLCVAVPQMGRAWAILAISLLVGFVLHSAHHRARALALTEPTDKALRRKAFPASHPLSRWLVVWEEHQAFRAKLVDTRAEKILSEHTMPKGVPPAPVTASERLLSVRGFKNSVIFPQWSYQREDSIDHVTWSDLSYAWSQDIELYTLHVKMDDLGAVLLNEFHERW